jgi:hypothetical protein
MSPMLAFDEQLIETHGYDDEMRQLADRHYSRRTVGARQFLYAGRRLVLRDAAGDVLFVWMYPDHRLRADGQLGYHCAIFRNESSRLASEIILEAEHRAFDRWGPNRLYTYVAPRKIRSANPGYCFKRAGWHYVRDSKKGLHLLAKHDELARP